METAEYSLMDAAEGAMWWYRALHVRLLHELSPVRGRLLDAGCGTGGFLAVVRSRRRDLETVGLELNESAALRAAEKSQSHIVRGSVNQPPFPSQSFDAIVSADVLCHQAVSPQEALSEFFRLLRPGGLLVLNMPAHEWLRSAHDRRVLNARRVTRRSLRDMLSKSGFSRIKTRSWNSLLLPLMILRRKLFCRHQEAASDVAPISPWLNMTLYGVSALERWIPIPMPIGGSVMATAVRGPDRQGKSAVIGFTEKARSDSESDAAQAVADVLDLRIGKLGEHRQTQDLPRDVLRIPTPRRT